MRALWTGAISFGLVTIPVSLYPATKREELKFRLLRKSDQSPVNYKRVAEADGKEVPFTVQYREGQDATVTGASGIDSIHATKVNANTWDFALMSGGKEVGHVHRTVSADGKTLTAHNTGRQPSGATGDDTAVFDKK